ncbi:subtilisin-like protease SBT5.1 [Brassica napus]|nr:subtilisin-like protease SBT5.1 [Brassica napus]
MCLEVQEMTRCLRATFILFVFLLVIQNCESETSKSGDYIIYMGAASADESTGNDHHIDLMSTMLKRSGKTPMHRYKHGFSGFATHLSEDEARLMAEQPGVVSVFPDQMLPLHTTRSWDFLVQESYQKESTYFTEMNSQPELDVAVGDTIIGFIDSGIWPESESFNDMHMQPVPDRWKGTCMRGKKTEPDAFRCNRKLIGARYYNSSFLLDPDYETPRDFLGHGTHVASIAAGRTISDASYYGLAGGIMRGGSPTSRIAMYRACSLLGCRGSSILAAFDDAIADGVDIISISMGLFIDNLLEDPLSIGSFHAVERGITVVCSAGNLGPSGQSVVNAAPWMITVGASTIDRGFESNILLGGLDNIRLIKGAGINIANIDRTQSYPIIHARSAKKIGANEKAARNCAGNTMNRTIVEGKIVVCDNDYGNQAIQWKSEEVKRLGGTGVIVIDDKSMDLSYIDPSFLVTIVKPVDGLEIMSYINSTREPIAMIMPTRSRTGHELAPSIPSFSSRGPYLLTRSILKPDIAAPGVNILASWLIGDLNAAPQGKEPPLVNIESGTSMSCPHVSGIAARLKSENPSWSPAAIRSAIMTTAVQITNTGSHITTETGDKATPYDFGAGQVTIFGPSSPGLVYETNQIDYLNFLCYVGFTYDQIKRISTRIPQGFACPVQSSKGDISDINYPSISVSNFNGEESRRVSRTVTNVASRLIGEEDTVYNVSINAPKGLRVRVIPRSLHFKNIGDTLRYQVIFSSSTSTLKEDAFGSITWSNGMYRVRSPFVVTSKADI